MLADLTRRATSLGARRAALLGLIGLTVLLSWLYLLAARFQMASGASMGQPLAAVLAMWAAMTAGMMLPAAAPMFTAFDALNWRRGDAQQWATPVFVLAYLSLWIGVSVVGAVAQHRLAMSGLLMDARTPPHLSAGLLLVAGVYQLSPLKHACLRRCRTPLGFLLTEFRPGVKGAWRLGLLHGRDCIACCWALMGLMFVLGTMNLLWMAVLTLVMLAEKTLPAGDTIGRLAGVVFIAWGGRLLY